MIYFFFFWGQGMLGGGGEATFVFFFFNHKPAGVFLFKRKFCKSNIVICEPVKWASASGCLGGENMPRGWNPSFVNAAVRLEEPARVSWVQQGERVGSCFPLEGRCKPFCFKWREAANPVVAMIFFRRGRFSITATVCCSIVVSRGTCQFLSLKLLPSQACSAKEKSLVNQLLQFKVKHFI